MEEPIEPSETPLTADGASSTIFVRKLNYSTTQEQLINHFSKYAPVRHAVLVVDAKTKSSKGFGFVSFATPELAKSVLDSCQDTKLDNRVIHLELAKRRHREIVKTDSGKTAKPKEITSSRLIVRNLPWSIRRPDQLQTVFSKFGKVVDVTIPRGKNNKMKGFAFVQMKNKNDATKAIAGANNLELDGRAVAVDYSVPKNDWVAAETKNEEEQKSQTEKEEADDEKPDVSVEKNDEDMDEETESSIEDYENNDDEKSDLDDDDLNDNDTLISANDSDSESASDSESRPSPKKHEQSENTLFIRNLLFETTESDVLAFFRQYGPVRYVALVTDNLTGRSKGSAFVSFHRKDDAEAVLRISKKYKSDDYRGSASLVTADQTLTDVERLILQGRGLNATKAVNKEELSKIQAKPQNDKRHLYLLYEGFLTREACASETEYNMRQDSFKTRKKLLQSNPSLHISLTRLSLRNLPRSVTEKFLKKLGRAACVGFSEDVKNNKRSALSRDELMMDSLDGDNIKRKEGKKGIVRQAKIIYEIVKKTQRSKGYGFLEFATHRHALMALRWLNGRAIAGNDSDFASVNMKVDSCSSKDGEVNVDANNTEKSASPRKRLIVEFAVENAAILTRRKNHIAKSRATKQEQPKSPEMQTKRKLQDTKSEPTKKRKMLDISKKGSFDAAKRKKVYMKKTN